MTSFWRGVAAGLMVGVPAGALVMFCLVLASHYEEGAR